jgi:ABC-type nitrate/sulfonate/bicarbonate transport system substrate-binding protein/outer membrane protein OmpA-like peptidoglycan-associated protein
MNKQRKFRYTFFSILLVFIFSLFMACQKADDGSSANVGDFAEGDSIRVPLIAWGADIVTIYANGSSGRTVKGSLFDREGLNIELFREDDFNNQVNMFMEGKIVYLRGTIGMINMAVEKLSGDPKTRPVLIYQHSWSAGGDALVVKKGIESVKDLRGKSVAIQRMGPHVDYFLKLLKDGGLNTEDVRIVWTNDLVGPQGDTPMSKFYDSGIDAAFLIIPDALALTSNGTVGTGAEDSVRGARILLSTKTANRIISDVYAVRKDYFDKNRDAVRKFVKALMHGEEQVKDLFKNKGSDKYRKLMATSGKLLLDDEGAISDVEGMYGDAEMAGFDGNVRFFGDSRYPRNYRKLSTEIQSSLIPLRMMSRRIEILSAEWNYNELKSGLRYANVVQTSRFNPGQTSIVAEKLSSSSSSLFAFEIYFEPNQNSFSPSRYRKEFERVINFSSTYGGALITIEGHSDPMNYLRKKKQGAPDILLGKIKQSAKNLSYSRASSVRDEIVKFAASEGITLDPNQLTIIGRGISSPKHKIPQNQDQWQANMRVVFKIIQVEAEDNVFRPL